MTTHLVRFAFILLFFIGFSGCSKKEIIGNLPSINDGNNKLVGASAKDLLTTGTYSSVKVEIQYMPGFQPDAGAVNNLNTFLSGLVNKPGGIQITQTAIPSPGKTVLSLTDIAQVEKTNRTAYSAGSQLAVYILLTDAAYTDANVLGVAFRNTSIALMGKTLQDNSGAIGQVSRTKLETTVAEHEFGHLLGLVDLGSAMQMNHKDGAHGNHCTNQNCLMYYSSETTDLIGFLLTGNIPPLDANCLADLRANGGR